MIRSLLTFSMIALAVIFPFAGQQAGAQWQGLCQGGHWVDIGNGGNMCVKDQPQAPAGVPCPNGSTCPNGTYCSAFAPMCPPVGRKDCGFFHCALNEACGNNHDCVSGARVCANGTNFCGFGQKCTAALTCIAEGAVECKDGRICAPGTACGVTTCVDERRYACENVKCEDEHVCVRGECLALKKGSYLDRMAKEADKGLIDTAPCDPAARAQWKRFVLEQARGNDMGDLDVIPDHCQSAE